MELIISLKNIINSDEIIIIETLGAQVIFRSQFVPLLGVIINDEFVVDKIRQLPFVVDVREPLKGEYLEGDFLTTFNFIPSVTRRPLAQASYYGWGDTRVAIIDSGANLSNVVDHIDYTNTGYQDFIGHGTCVTNIVKYFAKGANIYSAKVGNEKPDELYVMRALEWAVIEKKVHAINLSVGFKRTSRCKGECELARIVNAIANTGVFVVVAAGNDGPKNNTLRCPSCASGAITVGALEEKNKICDYSSRGPVGGSKPNIVAPGRVVIDDINFGGTSCATPVVTGTIAAVVSTVNDINLVYTALYQTADDLKQPKHIQGMGALNIEKFTEVITDATMDRASKRQK